MRLRRLFILSLILLSTSLAHAKNPSRFVLLGGYNLSSPRTALSNGLTQYTGLAGGFGFNINLKENAYVEPVLFYVQRRYAGNYTLPTLMLPVLFKYEGKYLTLGVGPYIAMLLGASNDLGAPITSELLAMPTFDYGVVVHGGIKLPLTRKIKAVLDGRVTRAISEAYGGEYAFYWGQIQALIGVQIEVGKNAGQGRR